MATIEDSLNTKMDVLDTLHDFCKSERGDGDAAGDKRLDFMRPYITNLLKNKVSVLSGKSELNAMIKTLTDDQVTSISKLEHQTVDFFETKYSTEFNLTPESKQVITYDTILESWNANTNEKTNELWKSMRENQDVTILEITRGKTYNPDKFTQGELANLGNFILNFFFGLDLVTESTGIGKAKNVRVTFDAKTGLPGKIFTELDQVFNIMFPQTIADSATTSLNILKGRSEYIFPDNGKESILESATFSKGDYKLSYVNKNFSTKNPFGFSLDITNLKEKKSISAPFSSTQTEGPSVNYIIDILKLAKEKKNEALFKSLDASKKGNILSLGKAIDSDKDFKKKFIEQVGSETDGLLPDIKRSGDHEATIVSKKTREKMYQFLMFITIDILCALKSRNLRNPTIWHNAHHLILYRFPPSKEAMAKVQMSALQTSIQKNLNAIDKYSILKKGLNDNLDAQKKIFEMAASGFFPLVKKSREGIDAQEVQFIDNIENKAESIVTMLGRMRMVLLQGQVDKAKDLLTAFQKDPSLSKADLMKIQKLPMKTLEDIATGKITTVKIDTRDIPVLEFLKTISQNTKEFFDSLIAALDIHIDEQVLTSDKKLTKIMNFTKPIYQTKKTQNGQDRYILLNEDFPLFEYYPQNFLDLYESIVSMISLKAPEEGESSSAIRKYNAAFDKALETYQDQVNFLLAQFSEKSVSDTDIENLFASLDISQVPAKAGSTDKAEAKRIAAREYFQGTGLVDTLKTFVADKGILEPFVLPSPLQGGQQGGAKDLVLQHFDLSYLLFQVSSNAAIFLESAYSNEYPYWSALYFHKELIKDLNNPNNDESYLNYFYNKLCSVYTEFEKIESYLGTEGIAAETVKFKAVPDPRTKAFNQKQDIIDVSDKMTDFFNANPNVKRPKLNDILTKLTGQLYTENKTVETILTDMLLQWSIGYNELVYNSGYDFEQNDDTSILISFLLALDENANPVYAFNDNLSRRVVKDQEAIQNELSKFPSNQRRLVILFAFALLENIMNKEKESPFAIDLKKSYFSSQKEWNERLYSFLTTVIVTLQNKLEEDMRLNINILLGGARKWKVKKTRRHKSKRSKRHTRKRR